jgi:hypothetical protein
VLLRNLNLIHINTFLEPTFRVGELDIIPTHLSLPHPTIFCIGPIFETISSPPLTGMVVPFIPELHSNLYRRVSSAFPNFLIALSPVQSNAHHISPSKTNRNTGKQLTLLSVKANSSFLKRYPFSFSHFFVKNATISSVPLRNVSRFLQIESEVYPFFTI